MVGQHQSNKKNLCSSFQCLGKLKELSEVVNKIVQTALILLLLALVWTKKVWSFSHGLTDKKPMLDFNSELCVSYFFCVCVQWILGLGLPSFYSFRHN